MVRVIRLTYLGIISKFRKLSGFETLHDLFDPDEEQKDEYYQDGIRPAIFKSLIGKGHVEFSTG